ncbi:MAG: pentapeptide repeat-containing protein [Gloeocapsa sp. DLM2.Bin57]|nr:MAG: pentapeptide repeat-containing protein [Gloeocapsa sp. DLM2.Bin57]
MSLTSIFAKLILLLSAAIILVFLMATPTAFAQANRVNYTSTELQDRDFSNLDLHGSVFADADMRRANFSGANLEGSILTQGIFLEANLTGANLSDSLADRATFDQANLTNAIFVEAIAIRSRFFDAIITGADFTGTILDEYQVNLLCEYASGINPVTGVSTRDSLGCRD